MRIKHIGLPLIILAAAALPGAVVASDLNVAISLDPVTNTLDPQQDTSVVSGQILPNIFDTLISLAYDDTGTSSLQPGLATSWNRIDNRTIELELRHDVKFHDGTDFTAEDVIFTFDPTRVLAESWPGAAAMKSYLSGLTFEQIDEDTVRISTESDDPLLVFRLTHPTASIISKDGFEAAASIDDWSRNPIGTGPYQVEEYRPKEFIQLSGFADHWAGTPPSDSIKISIVPELASRISGLVAGDYDIVSDIPPDQLATIDGYDELETTGGAVNNIEFIVFDTSNEILQDPLLRQALSMGINRELIVGALWGNRTNIPRSYQLPAFADLYDADRPQPKFDLEAAKALVEQSNYQGQILPFRIRNNYYVNEVARAEIIAEMWRDIGVTVKIEVVESSSETFGGIRNASNSMSYPDPAGMQLRIWREGAYYDRNHVLDGIDRAAFFAPAEKLAQAIDIGERTQATADWLDQWDSQLPGTVLHQSTRYYGKSAQINWQAAPNLVMDFGPGALSF